MVSQSTTSTSSKASARPAKADHLSATFAALADPTRRAILARLADGEASVAELARPFAMSGPAISKHLKVLERAGLIARSREAQWRPSRLEVGPLKRAAHWLDEYRRFWDASFDRLEDYLRDVQAGQKPKTSTKPTKPTTKKGSERDRKARR
jgi:DNA-binding transcriptional ArsR family regulator